LAADGILVNSYSRGDDIQAVQDYWNYQRGKHLPIIYMSGRLYFAIVNRGKSLGRQTAKKLTKKQATIFVKRSVTLLIFCLMLVDYV